MELGVDGTDTSIPDYRQARKEHKLLDILALLIVCVASFGGDWEDAIL